MTARECFNRIVDGHKNALPRPPVESTDRALRKLVEKANHEDDCIINVGNGYYRPVPGNIIDEKELKEYLAEELSRARKIQKKRLSMRLTFERWKDDELYAYHSGKTGRA